MRLFAASQDQVVIRFTSQVLFQPMRSIYRVGAGGYLSKEAI